MRILLQFQLGCLIFLLFLVFSSSSSDIFGSFWIFFWWKSSFFPIQSKKTEKIDKSSKPSAARCDWMKAVGRDLNPPITERLNKSDFFFFKKNLMRNKALLDHPESSLHNRKSKFFFSFKINIKKGQNFMQIYFLCQPNSIPRRFILFFLY